MPLIDKAKHLVDIFKLAAEEFGNDQAFYTKDNHKFFRPVTMPQVTRQAENLAIVLAGLGVAPRDNVALIADNRIEWLYADLAIQMNGAAVVPRGSDSTADEILYILNHCEAEVCFIEHNRLYKKIQPVLAKSKVKHIIALDSAFKKRDGVENIYDLLATGENQRKEKLKEINSRTQSIKPQDLFTIIYTSGTTGQPKGVMLSHANMLYQLEIMPNLLGMNNSDRVLSILPIWHIFERVLEYALVSVGASMYYSSNKDLREDFIRVKPTFMGSAPRMWESIYHRLKERIDKTEAFNREMFDVSYDVKRLLHRSINYLRGNELLRKEESIFDKAINSVTSALTSAALALPDLYLDSIYLSKVRAMLGGELKGTISGGGALPPHIDEFFNAIGIPVYEGYGMTECSPLISMRTRGRVVQGSVGFIPPRTSVKIIKEGGDEARTGEAGVIHVKGPGVMQGYYKNPEATNAVLKNGWLNTGDIGFKSTIGTLTIVGRAKDTIVLLGGENIEPVPIETALTQHTLVEQAVVVGQDKKHLGVLIWPNYDQLIDAGYNVSEFNQEDDLNHKPEIMKLFKKIVHEIVSNKNGFKSFEHIHQVRFLPDKLRIGKELTNLLKIKRNVIHEKYKDLINSMYQG